MMKPFRYILLLFSATILTPYIHSVTFPSGGDSEEITTEDDRYYPAIIELENGEDASSLEKEGVIILRQRENLLLCYIPLNSSSSSTRASEDGRDSLKGVKNIHRGRKIVPSMDKAREWWDAYKIHEGVSLPSPYTGKGVVTGICDIGIDPLHIAFLDNEGNPRIKKVVQYIEGEGMRIEMSTAEEYAHWETDDTERWHATHVAGIMAGGFGQYKGMAPESDIVITTSRLSDVGLLCGAEDILEYAAQEGKRAVINMSMGNYTGPHDGTSLFSRYLDLIGEEAIVVLSAGNEGSQAVSLLYTFSEDKNRVALPLYSTDWVQFNPYGAIDVWSRDDSAVNVRLAIYDSDRGTFFKYFPWQSLHNFQSFTIASDSESTPASFIENVVIDPDFANIYKGWFSFSGGVDKTNGRYQVIMQYDAHTDLFSEKGRWARYVPVIEVEGEPGKTAEIYADAQYTVFRRLPGEPAPGSELSFSDLATGNNLISVGMYVNRDSLPILNSEEEATANEAGTVSRYSSYATLADGRVMPLTVGPGEYMISAMSRHFMKGHPDSETLNHSDTVNGEEYIWATCSGTSMSSPFVAGAIACWLEAIPDMTIDQIKEIITASNRHDYPDPDNPRHGSGWFDPYQGLRVALDKFSGINAATKIEEDNSRLTYSGRHLTLWNPSAKTQEIDIYSGAGEKICTLKSTLPLETFPLNSFLPGLYIAKARNSQATCKFIVSF